VSHRLAGCCCESNPCQGPSGSCCMPDGTCVDVSCAYDCLQRGGTFRAGVTCQNGLPCPNTIGDPCTCTSNPNWGYYHLPILVTYALKHILTGKQKNCTDPRGNLDTKYCYLGFATFLTTQADFDAGLLGRPEDVCKTFNTHTDLNGNQLPCGNFTFSDFDPRTGCSYEKTTTATIEWTRIDRGDCCSFPTLPVIALTGEPGFGRLGNGSSWDSPAETIYWDGPSWEWAVQPWYNFPGICRDCCCDHVRSACDEVRNYGGC